MKDQEFKKYHLLTKNTMSSDHHIFRATGSLYRKNSKSDPSYMLSGGCVFIDHVSGYVIINHQVSISATENVKEKITFDREAQSQVVAIKGYHTYNGIFSASEFVEDLLNKQKNIRFSGSGDSYQNGASCSTIKKLIITARTMLMYAAMRCPEDILAIV